MDSLLEIQISVYGLEVQIPMCTGKGRKGERKRIVLGVVDHTHRNIIYSPWGTQALDFV